MGAAATGVGLAAASSAAGQAKTARGAASRALPDLTDPDAALRTIVRMQGSLREEDVPWWFTGVIFAVTGDDATPRPLLRFEGMEIYWFRHVADGFILGGHTVTFFRDFMTGEYLQEFENPWTRRKETVKPAVQGGNLGFKYSRDGIQPVRLDGTPLGPAPVGPFRPQFHRLGGYVWLQHQTVYPPGMPAMHGQRQTLFADERDVADTRLAAVPATFSSTVFMGWLKWMDMNGIPGHVVWHASGAKLRDIGELPAAYRERAMREFPERMTARPRA
ncbi:MAG: DUF1838 family protein [Planctomycetia bacterium]